ncbi:hypothetical protein L2E82_45815 [Cichorium intybus]|uniref:Uncharacterized protein n=1 Tax=Cichorium intybus TaxID=13427 RepID=A0ACB8ZUK7_CICIN|nr:hypothetical protein L2E82_45815 [Cichorium intybus]
MRVTGKPKIIVSLHYNIEVVVHSTVVFAAINNRCCLCHIKREDPRKICGESHGYSMFLGGLFVGSTDDKSRNVALCSLAHG